MMHFRWWVIGLCLVLLTGRARAGELPEILRRVLEVDTAFQSVSCNIAIELDVPGLTMPEKRVTLTLEKGKKPAIESEGITILPRIGMMGQYRKYLETDSQAILISENRDTVVYKVVSLDRRSDWVTVDLIVSKPDAKIHRMRVSTRKSGEYLVLHQYGSTTDIFPERTEIRFETVPLSLPLKFMGRQEGMEGAFRQKGPVTGRVILRYSDISWTLPSD